MDWKQYFDTLIDWKQLPAYKAETRIDSLVGFYLKDILTDFLDDPITGIIPELPIRLGTIKPELETTLHAERSYKVDFFAIGSKGKNYLVEFKSDSGSRNEKQDDYLKLTQAIGTERLLEGILSIAKASQYKKKYDHLKDKLVACRLLATDLQIIAQNEELEIVYVQPGKKENTDRVIDFLWIAAWLQKQDPYTPFEKELVRALIIWAKD